MYTPSPINIDDVILSEEIMSLAEILAKNVHEVWAKNRMAQGWSYGDLRNDILKEHPCLIPYEKLSEDEKILDEATMLSTLKLITKLGYVIVPKNP